MSITTNKMLPIGVSDFREISRALRNADGARLFICRQNSAD